MSSMNTEQLQRLLEAALMVYGKPMSIDKIVQLFEEDKKPTVGEIREALTGLAEHYADRGIELKEVASGFRFQAKQDYAEWIARLWEEKPPKYSRALLETLALIAYRQPITRSEIEDVRGVSVSSHIVKTLLEREWVRIVGYRDVPGRPALYATTKDFLDYFDLKNLEDLPTLSEIRDLDKINAELDFGDRTETNDSPSGESSGKDLFVSIEGPASNADSDTQANQNDDFEEHQKVEMTDTAAVAVESVEAGVAGADTIDDEPLQLSVSEQNIENMTDERLVEQADLAKAENQIADYSTVNDAHEPERVTNGDDGNNVENRASVENNNDLDDAMSTQGKDKKTLS